MKRQINGFVVDTVTLGRLAKMCECSTKNMYRMMERKIIPPSNIRDAPVRLTDGTSREGARLYSRELAEKVSALVRTFEQGKKITDAQRNLMYSYFDDEKSKLKL